MSAIGETLWILEIKDENDVIYIAVLERHGNTLQARAGTDQWYLHDLDERYIGTFRDGVECRLHDLIFRGALLS